MGALGLMILETGSYLLKCCFEEAICVFSITSSRGVVLIWPLSHGTEPSCGLEVWEL